MRAQILAVAGAVLVLIVVVQLMRQRKLREKYATIWLLVSLSAVLFTVFPSFSIWLANVFGFQSPINLFFCIAGLVLLVISIQTSIELGRSEDRIRRLAEETAIQEQQIVMLEGEVERLNQSARGTDDG